MKTILPVALAVLRPVTLAKITLLPVKAAKRTTTSLVKTLVLHALQVPINNLKISWIIVTIATIMAVIHVVIIIIPVVLPLARLV